MRANPEEIYVRDKLRKENFLSLPTMPGKFKTKSEAFKEIDRRSHMLSKEIVLEKPTTENIERHRDSIGTSTSAMAEELSNSINKLSDEQLSWLLQNEANEDSTEAIKKILSTRKRKRSRIINRAVINNFYLAIQTDYKSYSLNDNEISERKAKYAIMYLIYLFIKEIYQHRAEEILKEPLLKNPKYSKLYADCQYIRGQLMMESLTLLHQNKLDQELKKKQRQLQYTEKYIYKPVNYMQLALCGTPNKLSFKALSGIIHYHLDEQRNLIKRNRLEIKRIGSLIYNRKSATQKSIYLPKIKQDVKTGIPASEIRKKYPELPDSTFYDYLKISRNS